MNINPNKWSCLPTSFANVIGVPLGLLIDKIGHDGSECIPAWDGERRGFHSQECIDVLDSLGWAVTSIEVQPLSGHPEHDFVLSVDVGFPPDRLFRHMDLTNGVLCGILRVEGHKVGHAVAWIDGRIHDPRGCGLVRKAEGFLYKDFEPRWYHKVQSI